MRGKILFVAGLAAGYVLGAKAGRQRYNQIADAAGKVWNNPNVQRTVDTVEEFVKDHSPDVAELAAEGTRRVVNAAAGKGRKGRSTIGNTRRDTAPKGRSTIGNTRSTKPSTTKPRRASDSDEASS